MNKDAGAQRKLADQFRDRITEKHTDICSQVDVDSKKKNVLFHILCSNIIQ